MRNQEEVDDFFYRSEQIIAQFQKVEAFERITSEIDRCHAKYLNEYILVLNQLQHHKVLEWIENNACRVKNVSQNWGHLAASSNFDWK